MTTTSSEEQRATHKPVFVLNRETIATLTNPDEPVGIVKLQTSSPQTQCASIDGACWGC
jgi:hypothetical protein